MRSFRSDPLTIAGPALAIVVFAAVGVVPFIVAAYLSFTGYDLTSTERLTKGVGLANYLHALHDPIFAHAAAISLAFATISTLCEVAIGTSAALALASWIASSPARYAMCLMPAFVAPIVTALAWKLVLQSEFGVGTYLLREVGLFTNTSILSGARSSLVALGVIDVWQWTPFVFSLVAAAVATQPRRPLEAATLDGATRRQIALGITLPYIAPLLVVVGTVRFVDALRDFEKVYILTGGGPGVATEMLSNYIWRIAFRNWNLGYASALSMLGYILAMAATLLLFRVYRRRYAKAA